RTPTDLYPLSLQRRSSDLKRSRWPYRRCDFGLSGPQRVSTSPSYWGVYSICQAAVCYIYERIERQLATLDCAQGAHALHLLVLGDRKSTRLNSSHLGISYA